MTVSWSFSTTSQGLTSWPYLMNRGIFPSLGSRKYSLTYSTSSENATPGMSSIETSSLTTSSSRLMVPNRNWSTLDSPWWPAKRWSLITTINAERWGTPPLRSYLLTPCFISPMATSVISLASESLPTCCWWASTPLQASQKTNSAKTYKLNSNS